MPLLTISKTSDNEELYEVTSSLFSASEKINFNLLFRSDVVVTEEDSLPFALRRLILKGVIPIYDDNVSYDTRIMLSSPVKGIDINSKVMQTFLDMFNVKESKIYHDSVDKTKLQAYILDKITKIVPSETPINVIALLVPNNLLNNIITHKNLFPLYQDSNIFDVYTTFSNNIGHNRVNNDTLITHILEQFNLGINPPNNPLLFNELIKHEQVTFDSTKLTSLFNVIPNNNNIFRPTYAFKLEKSINDAIELLDSYVSHLERQDYLSQILESKYANFNEDTIRENTIIKQMNSLTLDENIVSYFKSVGLPVPYTEYEIVPLATLIMNNEFEDYLHDLLGQKFRRNRIAETKYIPRRVLKDFVALGKYAFAYKTLFGETEYNKLNLKNNTLIAFFDAIPKERKDKIDEEVKRLDVFWNSINANKCEHINVINKLNRAISQDDYKKVFNELITYVKPNKESEAFEGFCICKLCNLRLVCPHKFITMDYIINEKSFEQIKRNFIPFIDNESKFKSSVICKICNEELFKKNIMDDNEHVPIILAEHRNALWKDASYLIHNYVKFSEAIFDKTALIRNMIHKCYALIINAVNNLPFGSNIEKWRSIYADKVFAAYLVNLERITKGDLKFNMTLFLNNISISQKVSTKKSIEEYKKVLSDIEINKIIKLVDNENYVYNTSIYILAALLLGMDIYTFCNKYILKDNKNKLVKNKFFVCNDLPNVKYDHDIKDVKGGGNNKEEGKEDKEDKIVSGQKYVYNRYIYKYNDCEELKDENINLEKIKISEETVTGGIYEEDVKEDVNYEYNEEQDYITLSTKPINYITIKNLQDIRNNPLATYTLSKLNEDKDLNEEVIIKTPDNRKYMRIKVIKYRNNNIPTPHKLVIEDVEKLDVYGGEDKEEYEEYEEYKKDKYKEDKYKKDKEEDEDIEEDSDYLTITTKNNRDISGGFERKFIKNVKVEDNININQNKAPVKLDIITEQVPLKKLRKKQLVDIYNILVEYCRSNEWAKVGNIDGPYKSPTTNKKIIENIRKIDEQNEKYRLKLLRRSIGRLPDSGKASSTKIYPKFNIREIFAPDGSRIKWDKLVYDKEIVDVKEGSYNKYGKFPNDKFSSKWNIYLNEEVKKDDNDLRKLIEANHITESLITYYFNICPEGGLHVRKSVSDKCTKCGIYLDMNKEDTTNFVIKYKNKYENSKSNIQIGMSNDIDTKSDENGSKKEVISSVSDAINTISKEESKTWLSIELNKELINLMEKRFTYPDAIWKYLGQCNGIKYDDLVSYRVIPPPITNMYNPAIFTLDSYINGFFVFRKSKGYDDRNFKIYKEIYRYKRNEDIEDEELLAKKSEELIDWMRAFFYKNALLFVGEDEETTLNTIKNIAYKDTLLCKNDLLYGAVIISDEQDFVGADELSVPLNTVEEGENPVFAEEAE
jgi:hypothetical protein